MPTAVLVAHLPGKHDQSTHAHGGAGVRASLAQAKTVGEVNAAAGAEAQRITGRDIPFDYGDIEPQLAREYSEGVLQGLERFPGAPLDAVRATDFPSERRSDEFTWAHTIRSSTPGRYEIEFNRSGEAAEKANEILAMNQARGAFAYGDVRGLALHEFGHVMHESQGTSSAARSLASAYAREHTPGGTPGKSGFMGIGRRKAASASDEEQRIFLLREVSFYSTYNEREFAAEAFADVMTQGADASPLSHQVMDLLENKILTGALVAADPGQPYVSPDDLNSIIPLWQTAVAEHVTPVVAEVFRDTADQLHAQLVNVTDLPQLPSVSSLAAETYLSQAANTFEQVGDDLWETARTQLLEGFQKGESIPELAARLRASAGLSAKTAVLVARTQVLDASNAASIATARVSGIPMRKGWLDTPDARTRESHLLAGSTYGTDEQMIDLEAQFVVGGYSCDRPHDPVLPPSEKYNCRCSLAYSVSDDDIAVARDLHTPEPLLPNTSGQQPTGMEDLTEDARAAAAGEGVREQLAGGQVGISERITLPNGRDLFGKESTGWFGRTGEEITDAEELTSLVGQAINAPVPRVIRDAPRHIYSDWAQGRPGVEWFTNRLQAELDGPADNEFLQAVVDSGSGKRLGLLDMLVQNGDRHTSNWLVTSEGILTGVDHGNSWWFDEFSAPDEWLVDPVPPGEAAPFPQVVRGGLEGPFVRDRWFDQAQLEDNGLAVPVDTDVWTPGDVLETRRRLRKLRPDFLRLGHGDWLDYSLKVLDLLESHATGSESIFDG